MLYFHCYFIKYRPLVFGKRSISVQAQFVGVRNLYCHTQDHQHPQVDGIEGVEEPLAERRFSPFFSVIQEHEGNHQEGHPVGIHAKHVKALIPLDASEQRKEQHKAVNKDLSFISTFRNYLCSPASSG